MIIMTAILTLLEEISCSWLVPWSTVNWQ